MGLGLRLRPGGPDLLPSPPRFLPDSLSTLLPHPQPLPELIRGLHPLHHLGGDELAGLVVPREGVQRARVPRPLLQHLRRRLHEVPLGGDPADAGPALVAGEDVVDEVAELVEERPDVGVEQ